MKRITYVFSAPIASDHDNPKHVAETLDHKIEALGKRLARFEPRFDPREDGSEGTWRVALNVEVSEDDAKTVKTEAEAFVADARNAGVTVAMVNPEDVRGQEAP